MKLNYTIILLITLLIQSCGIYNFTGGNVGAAETYQVNFFYNLATQSPGSIIEPGLDRDFTIALQDMIQNQTSLKLSSDGADLIYEGEIVEYRIAPMSATANMTAAQNRLSMSINVRFTNTTKDDADFEKRFNFFYDYPADALLNSVKTEAHQALFERITQDIFNASLADW